MVVVVVVVVAAAVVVAVVANYSDPRFRGLYTC